MRCPHLLSAKRRECSGGDDHHGDAPRAWVGLEVVEDVERGDVLQQVVEEDDLGTELLGERHALASRAHDEHVDLARLGALLHLGQEIPGGLPFEHDVKHERRRAERAELLARVIDGARRHDLEDREREELLVDEHRYSVVLDDVSMSGEAGESR